MAAINILSYLQSILLMGNPYFATEFYRWSCLITFPFGLFGNLASLLTFSRPTLRHVSTGCLYIVLAASDIFFLLITIIDYLEYGWKVDFYENVAAYDQLCRFRYFTLYVTQFCSAWTLVLISVDRWIRARLPFKAIRLCTPKKVLFVVTVYVGVAVAIHAHMLTSSFGTFLPGIIGASCGAKLGKDQTYDTFYYFTWPVWQAFNNCVIPVGIMLIILGDIYVNSRIRKQLISRRTSQHNKYRETQMFILMLSSIATFIITTLPIFLYSIIVPRQFLDMDPIMTFIILAILNWFKSLNYTINFYVHCLTSKLFRKEFIKEVNLFYNFIHNHNHQTAVIQLNPIHINKQVPRQCF